MERELLSVGRESLVYREGESVIKCYTPEDNLYFGDLYRELFKDDCFHLRPYDLNERRNFFNVERRFLRTYSEAKPRVVPQFQGRNPKKLSIKMKFILAPTFQQAILTQDIDPDAATERMVQNLAQLHLLSNASEALLCRQAGLKPRSEQGEKDRWINYLQAIVFYESIDFEEYLGRQGIDVQALTPSEIRGHINMFLGERGINLDERVAEFIHRDRILTGGEESFVWAEAKPSNMFYFSDPQQETVMIDFPRARRGAGSDIDLFNIVNHLHRPPFRPEEEEKSIFFVNEYLKRMGIPLSEFPARHARLLAARVKEMIRLHANYCQKTTQDIQKLLGLDVTIPGPGTNGEIKDKFLVERLDSLRKFFDYYRYRQGEGWEVVVEEPLADNPEGQKLVRAQIDTIDGILRESGVFRGIISNQRRARRFRAILAPNY